MATSAQQDRDAKTDAQVRRLLGEGNTRAALHCAREALEAEAAAVRKADPTRGALLDAMLAGSLSAQAAALAAIQPRRPPGYSGGPPAAEHLLHAYTSARNETARQQ